MWAIKLDGDLWHWVRGMIQVMKRPKTNIWTLVLAVAFALVIMVLDLTPWFKNVPWYGFFIVPVIWIALWSAEDDILPLTTVAVIVTGRLVYLADADRLFTARVSGHAAVAAE